MPGRRTPGQEPDPRRLDWRAHIILTPAPVCGWKANWSISKIWFSTTPAWTSAPRPTNSPAPTPCYGPGAASPTRSRIGRHRRRGSTACAAAPGRASGRRAGASERKGSEASSAATIAETLIDTSLGGIESDPHLAAAFAAVDAANAKAERTLTGGSRTQSERDPVVYDPDWDEDARLDDWRAVVEQTRILPPTLAAALATEAWDAIAPLQHTPWLGRLLAASVLRARAKTRWHLPCLHDGLKAIPRERRRPRDAAARLAVQLEAITAAAAAGLKDHDRWLNQRTLLARKLAGRRATSKLPALLDYMLTRPIASAGMIAKELKITPRAAQDQVGELDLREVTGRGRYRAWGIL
ncbi:RHE_PE00001 family protein [Bradyrhizobium japonicum]|uniref:RHE_PE00001 family protein n=1 Tax=Bradyrhizobium japonicum TaxID=375 RepID=UPI00201BECFA|nr:RHE_PE00001 family protein [Bradyrhizobium japonicum]